MAERIIVNAKTQRPGVCNALETLLIHKDVAETFVPRIAATLDGLKVELRGDDGLPAVRACRRSRPPRRTGTPSTWS